jgi:hypothetical protein
MRGGRSLLLLLVILVPVAYFGVREYKDPTPATDEKKLDKVFTVEADKIEEVTIKSESGARTTVRKSGSDWQVVAPTEGAPVAADSSELSGITSNLATLEQQRVIDENASDLKEYGLDQPRVEVTFKADGKEQSLLIGSKTPTGGDLYARQGGQQKVFLIPSYVESTFNRTTFDLREKAALKVDAATVDSLEVTADGRTLVFKKADGAWQLASPPEPRSDASAIDSLVSRLVSTQMKSLTPATDADLGKYGLDKPTVTARVGAGSAQATLIFGKVGPDATVYAKDVARPGVFTVESPIWNELKKGAAEYRQKDLFEARAFNTTKIELTRGADKFLFEKKTEKDKDGKDVEKWRQAAPAQKEADPEKVATLLSTVTGARATSFVDKAAGAKVEVSVALTANGKEERVSFSRSGSDAFAARDGVPGFARIDTTLLDDIIKAAEALR